MNCEKWEKTPRSTNWIVKWNSDGISAAFLIGKISSLTMGKNEDCLENPQGMRPFSLHLLRFLQRKRSKELPCQDESGSWNLRIDDDGGGPQARQHQMQTSKFQQFLKVTSVHVNQLLFPRPWFLSCHLYYKHGSR